MAKTLQFRRGTSAELNTITGAEGELFVDLDTNAIRVHNGNTQGGVALSTLAETEAAYSNAVAFVNNQTGANGISYSSGVIAADQDISSGANVTFTEVTGLDAPTDSTDAANKQYVDEVAEGLTTRTAADVLSDSNLSATYANNTLTASANGAFPAIDDITLDTQFDRVLVTGQSNAAHNGLYVLDVVGDGTTPWELIRCNECNENSEIPGSFVFVKSGTVYEASGWVAIVDDPDTFTLGTDDINWTQFSGAGTFTAGEGLELNGSQFSLDSSIAGDSLTYNAGVLNVSNVGATITDDTTSNTDFYPVFTDATSGNFSDATVSSTKLFFEPDTGTLNATNFNSLSDATVKTNINEISNGLDIINSVSGVEFDWKDNGNHSSGVVAQELEKILPHLVSTSNEGVKSVNYAGLTAYLLSAIQELSSKINK